MSFYPSGRLRTKLAPFGAELDARRGSISDHPEPALLQAWVPLLRAAESAARRLAPDDRVAAGLLEWLEERTGRDPALGADPGSPTVAAVIGSIYYWIFHGHPVAILGFAAVEANPASPVGFEEVAVLLDSLPLTADHEALVGIAALQTADLLVQLDDELLDDEAAGPVLAPALPSGDLLLIATGSSLVMQLPAYLTHIAHHLPGRLRVLLTQAAESFVRPEAIRWLCDDVYTSSSPGLNPVELAKTCTGIIVLPATANFIAHAALGLASTPAATAVLAAPRPCLFFPQMNPSMWAKPIVQRHVADLRTAGHTVVEPEPQEAFVISSRSFEMGPATATPEAAAEIIGNWMPRTLVPAANEAQHEQWNGNEAAHWIAHQDRYDAMLAPFSESILAAAAIGSGDRVLDVGCGCGGTTLAAARAAERALGIDLSEPMLAVARRDAESKRLANVSFVGGDAQTHPFAPDSHTVAISRFGVMFFDDPVAAFTNIAASLVPGGRLVFACWQELARNDWLLVPGAAVAQHLPLPDPGPSDAPGMFALADPSRTRALLEDAGFVDVSFSPAEASILVGGGGTVDDTLEFLRSSGIGRAVLEGAEPAAQARAIAAMREVLAPFTDADGVHLGAAAWIVTARTRP